MIIAAPIDDLGGMPLTESKPVKTSIDPQFILLRFDFENEDETIGYYRERVRQCEALGENASAEHIRGFLLDVQHHRITLAMVLDVEIPNVSRNHPMKLQRI